MLEACPSQISVICQDDPTKSSLCKAEVPHFDWWPLQEAVDAATSKFREPKWRMGV